MDLKHIREIDACTIVNPVLIQQNVKMVWGGRELDPQELDGVVKTAQALKQSILKHYTDEFFKLQEEVGHIEEAQVTTPVFLKVLDTFLCTDFEALRGFAPMRGYSDQELNDLIAECCIIRDYLGLSTQS